MTVAVAVEWEPRALDSCDARGCSVLTGVKDSGKAEGAVARWGTPSAGDTAPEDGAVLSGTVALVSGENSDGGAAVTSSLGAAARKTQRNISDEEI